MRENRMTYFQRFAGVLWRRLKLRGLPRVRELTDKEDPRREAYGLIKHGIIYLRYINPRTNKPFSRAFITATLMHEIAHKFAQYHTPRFARALRRVQRAARD